MTSLDDITQESYKDLIEMLGNECFSDPSRHPNALEVLGPSNGWWAQGQKRQAAPKKAEWSQANLIAEGTPMLQDKQNVFAKKKSCNPIEQHPSDP